MCTKRLKMEIFQIIRDGPYIFFLNMERVYFIFPSFFFNFLPEYHFFLVQLVSELLFNTFY